MVNLLFVGDPIRGHNIEEWAGPRREEYVYEIYDTGVCDLREIRDDICMRGRKDFTIFDLMQCDSADTAVLVAMISGICKSNCSKPIIFAVGYSRRAEIILALHAEGIRNFIFESSYWLQDTELEHCLCGWFEANDPLFDVLVEKQEEERKAGKMRTIGVMGACHRVGTTTHAIQIVKWLQMKGYKAAYVQMNNTGYVEFLRNKSWYEYEETEEDAELGRHTVDGVDHFYKQDRISAVLQLDYDFFVYDFGVPSDTDFNKHQFQEKDVKVVVAGMEGRDVLSLINITDSRDYCDVKFVINFAYEEQREFLPLLIGERANDSVMSMKYIPDKYVLADSGLYDGIIEVEDRPGDGAEEKNPSGRRGPLSARARRKKGVQGEGG